MYKLLCFVLIISFSIPVFCYDLSNLIPDNIELSILKDVATKGFSNIDGKNFKSPISIFPDIVATKGQVSIEGDKIVFSKCSFPVANGTMTINGTGNMMSKTFYGSMKMENMNLFELGFNESSKNVLRNLFNLSGNNLNISGNALNISGNDSEMKISGNISMPECQTIPSCKINISLDMVNKNMIIKLDNQPDFPKGVEIITDSLGNIQLDSRTMLLLRKREADKLLSNTKKNKTGSDYNDLLSDTPNKNSSPELKLFLIKNNPLFRNKL
ncbi:hypothetical protein KAJ27_02110 [bacterium]|nr:hypothetical protein [bacterium]